MSRTTDKYLELLAQEFTLDELLVLKEIMSEYVKENEELIYMDILKKIELQIMRGGE